MMCIDAARVDVVLRDTRTRTVPVHMDIPILYVDRKYTNNQRWSSVMTSNPRWVQIVRPLIVSETSQRTGI